MTKTKSANSDYSDLLGIAAFISAVGNIVHAYTNNNLKDLYENLLTRYQEVCNQYQTLAQMNQQLQQEVLHLRQLNNLLQGRMGTQRRKRVRRKVQSIQTP